MSAGERVIVHDHLSLFYLGRVSVPYKTKVKEVEKKYKSAGKSRTNFLRHKPPRRGPAEGPGGPPTTGEAPSWLYASGALRHPSLRNFSTIGGELAHDLLMEPNIHFG